MFKPPNRHAAATLTRPFLSRTFASATPRHRPFTPDPNAAPPNPLRRFVDTHAHIEAVLRRKRLLVSSASWSALSNAYLFSSTQHPDSQNLAGIINVNSDPSAFAAGKAIEGFSELVWSTWGVHPLKAGLYDEKLEKVLEKYMNSPKAVAVGETGLDYVKIPAGNEGPTKFIQKMVFGRHLQLAKKLGKPVSVHMRGAEQDTFDVLKDNLDENHRIHIMCYTGTTELIKMLMDQFPNVYFGVAGLATYASESERRDDIVRYLPLEKILLETVSPNIAPEPFRGKVGHPGLIPYIAERIATTKGVPVEDVYAGARKAVKGCYGIEI